jgi:hypothetical protein
MRRIFWIITPIIGAALLISTSCSSGGSGTFTYAPTSGTPVVSIANILSHPDIYQGKQVVVKGKIMTECPAGCWFTMKDNTASIYVDLKPANLVIPQRVGKQITVLAEVLVQGSDITLNGEQLGF